MYDDSVSNIDEMNINKESRINWFIVIILVIITLIVAYSVLFKDLFKNKYAKLEEEMVSEAKDYILRNNMSISREIYLDVTKLNISLDDNCSLTSGVLYDGETLYPNLVCNEYKSRVIKENSNISNYIKLKGDEVVVLAKGMTFFDPGYESNEKVVTVGNVGNEEGVYNLFYKTINSNRIAKRKIIIIDNQEIRNLFPIIALNGDEIVYLVSGNEYNDLGITAYDSIDGNISNNVVIDNNLDINIPGEYIISYTLTNSRGYSNTITRKVNVISEDSDIVVDYTINPRYLTNEDVLIRLNISNDYKKIIYPNGEEGTELTYLVSENGIYKFSIYDNYDRVIEKEIEIDNIDKTKPEGSCTATRYYNKTNIKVTINNNREISSYWYVVNGKESKNTQSTTYTSTTIKPASVKVIVLDIIGNKSEITCSFEDKLTREIVTDEKGKNCLEGYVCYIQFDYSSSKYPYCSMSNNPNSCGGIGRNGCSITSASNAIAAMGVKSKNGTLYTPFTVWDELYPINKNTGQCGGGCSGWTRIRDSIINAGLSAPRKVERLNNSTVLKLVEHLKMGYPVIVYAEGKPFSSSRAHYLTLLSIRDDGYVFLSDSANRSGTKKAVYNGKQYYVDTWIPISDLISGNIKEYLLVGPYGLYEGK